MSEPRKIYGGIDQSSRYDPDSPLNGLQLTDEEPVTSLGDIGIEQARARLNSAYGQDANALLQAEQYSKNTGLSLFAALEDPDNAKRESFAQKNAEILRDSPVTADFVNRNPRYAALLNNPATLQDVSFFEGLANGLKRGGLGAKMMFHQWRSEKMKQFAEDEGKSPFEIWQDMRTDQGTRAAEPLSVLDLLSGLDRWASSRLNPGAYAEHLRHMRQVGRYSRARQERPYSAATDAWMQGIREREDVFGKLGAVVSDPLGLAAFVSENLLEALPQLIPAVVAGALTRSPGMGIAALGAGSYSAERFNSTVEFLEASGVDFKRSKDVYNLFRNPELWRQAKQRGMRRGAVIAGIDMLSGGVASKALAQNPLGDLVLQLGVQSGLAAGGEALAQKVAGQEFDLNQVIFEGIGELGTAPIEIYGVARPVFSRIRDMTDEARAEVKHKVFAGLARHLQKQKASKDSGELRAAHASEVLRNLSIEAASIPADALLRAKETLGAGWLASLEMGGAQRRLQDMAENGQDVTISSESFVKHVLENEDASNLILDHIRLRPEDLTQAEAVTQKAYNDSLNAMEQARYQEGLRQGFEDVKPPQDLESAELLADARHAIGLSILMDGKATEADFIKKSLAASLSEQEAVRVVQLEHKKRKPQAAFQKRVEQEMPAAEAEVSRTPVYQALAYLQKQKKKLSKEQAFAVMDAETRAEKQALMKSLPAKAFGSKGGLDIDDVAGMFGFDSSEALLMRMQNIPAFNVMVRMTAEKKANEKFPFYKPYIMRLDEAIERIYKTGEFPESILSDLNELRGRQGLADVRHYMIQNKANLALREMRLREISPERFQKAQQNAAIAARDAFQKDMREGPGDFKSAAEYKYIQAVNYELMGRAYEVDKEIEAFSRLAKKYSNRRVDAGDTPIEYVEAAQQILRAFGLSRGPVKKVDLRAWADKKFNEGVVMSLPNWVLDLRGQNKNLNDLSLLKFRQLAAAIKSIIQNGEFENKLLNRQAGQTIAFVGNEVAEGVIENFKKDRFEEAGRVSHAKQEAAFVSMMSNFHQYAKKGDRFLGSIILSAETLLGKIDGWKSEGVAKTAIKTPIDRAFFDGFGYVTIDGKKQNRIGFLPRMEKELARLNEVFAVLGKTYAKKMNKKYSIPGVHRKITNGQRLALFLNLGAESNYAALLKGRNFSEAEINILVESMTRDEFRFVKKAWEFLGSFRDEVDATLRERDNRPLIDKVPMAYETPHGMLEGGYYPLRYQSEEGLMFRSTGGVEEAFKEMMQSSPLLAYTNDGHTIEEVGTAGAAVELEIDVLKSHLRQVVYDLEVGDAVRDSWKILNSRAVKNAFKEQKRVDVWTGLSTWLADTATGEIFRGHVFDKTLRHVRVGTIIAKLAWRLSIGAIQTAGVFQSAALVGKRNMTMGIIDLFRFGGIETVNKAYDFVTNASEFMARREHMIDRDIELFYEKYAGKHKALIDLGFIFIRKGQKFTDSTTWLAAYRQGLQKFQGDYDRAVAHADNMVSQTQGTALHHQRSGVERGTLSEAIRNQEWVRAFVVFMGHFIRKLNILYQITSDYKNNSKTFMSSVNYISNVFFLVLAESLLIAYFSGDFDDDEDVGDLAGTALKEGLGTLAAGVPVVRNIPFMLEYNVTSSGSAGGSFIQDLTAVMDQIGQGEFDRGMINALGEVAGVALKLPSQAIKDTGWAIVDAADGKDVKPLEFITGQ